MSKTQTQTFLGREELKKLVPAAFSRSCDPEVSDRYQFIPTTEILDRMEERGLYPVSARQNMVLEDQRYAFHEIRLAPKRGVQLVEGIKDNVRRQAIITNSHNRTRRLTIMAGFFRLICSNGLIAPLKGTEGESLGYSGRSLHLKSLNPLQMINAAFESLDRGGELIKRMEDRKLTSLEQGKFTRDSLAHVYGEDHAKKLDSTLWTTARRDEDGGNDLWHVFNRVQENVVKGGVQLPSGRFTRPLGNAPRTGALTQVRFNEFIWTRALQFLN